MAALVGACLGSFANVVVWRLPRGESVVHPGSRCPSCGHAIPWYRNLPILTWLLQRGRCAWCGVRIPVFYVLVEALCLLIGLSGVLLFMNGWTVGDAAGWTLFALAAVPISLIDWERFEIPDSLIFWTLMGGVAVRTFAVEDHVGAFIFVGRDSLLAGGALYALHFLSRYLVGVWGSFIRSILPCGIRWSWRRGWKKDVLIALLRWGRFHPDMEALGLGDVSLGLAAGACLGFPSVALGLAPAALLGVGGYLLRRRYPPAQSAVDLGLDPQAVPFGPFLCIGFLLASVWIRLGGSFFRF
jgi:leader peptidase (prepilin peptidase) / N-methyltransferase